MPRSSPPTPRRRRSGPRRRPSYRKICINWVQTARQQATNDKRMAQLVEDCAAGRLIPSQRYGEMPKWVDRAAAAAAAAAAGPS